ncbi:MAG: methyltransferase domain-containing protein [Tepidiformaceae bacterium]
MNRAKLRRVYAFWAPLYDPLYERFYRSLRRESIAHLRIGPNERVLVVGSGTGSDFRFLAGANVVAVDASLPMLHRSRAKARSGNVQLLLADGEQLPFREGVFDAAVLHLILTVTPSGHELLAEVSRVLRVGARVAVCDHFAPVHGSSRLRRAITPLAELLGTRFDRTFDDVSAGLPFTVTRDAWQKLRCYRLLQLRHKE